MCLKMCSLKLLLVILISFSGIKINVHCTFVTSFDGRACPGFQNISCEGEGDIVSWTSASSATPTLSINNGFIPPPDANETFTFSMGTQGTGFSGTISASFTPVQSPSMYNFSSTYTINATVQTRVTCSDGTGDIGTVVIEQASPPSAPLMLRQLRRRVFMNSVEVTVGWDPPADNGGRDDVTYVETISPPAQLSATVVTSTSVDVSAADYNTDYTVTVQTMNCAGFSDPRVYRFRVDGCPVPTAPFNGFIGPIIDRTVGSMVTFRCGSGFIPPDEFTATCLDTLTWGPRDPAIFECTEQPSVATDPFTQSAFTGLDITLSVVVSSTIAVLIGLAIGVCATYLLLHGRTQDSGKEEQIDVVEEEEPQTFPPPVPPLRVAAVRAVSPAQQLSSRPSTPSYEEVTSQTWDSEMEANYAYVRPVEF